MNFGLNLKRIRKTRHISQKELASLLGLAQRTISHYESGSCEPNLTCLCKIASILQVSLDELVGYEPTYSQF